MRNLDTQDGLYHDFDARVESAKTTPGTTNCLGTALYLAGKAPVDGWLRAPAAYDLVAAFPKLDAPIVGCLVVFAVLGRYVFHMGVVTSVDPLLVTHRPGRDGPIVENAPFAELHSKYVKTNPLQVSVEYRDVEN